MRGGGRNSRNLERLGLLVVCALLTGCSGEHSVLDPAGPQARHIGGLFWMFVGIGSAVYAVVAGFLLIGVFRRRRHQIDTGAPTTRPDHDSERGLRVFVISGVGVTVAILFVLIIADFVVGQRTSSLHAEEALTIRVTGHQWWWEIEYDHPIPGKIVTTANEIHIPTGQPVRFELQAQDVIHSLWIPNLGGKKDLVPGHPTSVWYMATEPSTFVGLCAEFCGRQHARMRLTVVAEPEDRFRSWLANQLQPALPPDSPDLRRGRDVFLTGSCALCHRISGTPANGHIGPDLTHLASRPTLAAGSVPNTRGFLAAWILDPHEIKPGVRMPPNQIGSQDLHALLDYLQSLN